MVWNAWSGIIDSKGRQDFSFSVRALEFEMVACSVMKLISRELGGWVRGVAPASDIKHLSLHVRIE